MPIINEYDALTDMNVQKTVSKTELDLIIGQVQSVSLADIIAQTTAAKASAKTKLAALGLTEEEIKAITA
jgi:cyanate lyase